MESFQEEEIKVTQKSEENNLAEDNLKKKQLGCRSCVKIEDKKSLYDESNRKEFYPV